MAGKISPTLKVLMEMRDDIRSLNGRVASLESTMKTLAPAVFDTVRLLQSRDDLRDRVADHERRLERLEQRTG